MGEKKELSSSFQMNADVSEYDKRERPPQEFYDDIKAKYADQRELRLGYRPPGTEMYRALDGEFADYETDPYAEEVIEREPITDEVEVLFIGGGFSALLTSARLRQRGVESIRIVERGADVGGTWYWNRYPGVACDVVSYDYLPFQTTVTSTMWNEEDQLWHVSTDRGDTMRARFVICANGTLAKPRLALIDGMETFEGTSFHTSRWDYDFTGTDLEKLSDLRVGIIGTGASAVQIVPNVGAHAKSLHVFQRTPSSIDIRDDWETKPEWAAKLQPGWQAKRRQKIIDKFRYQAEKRANLTGITREEKIRRQENANIDAMMRIHKRIDETVEDPATAESLKPWYMLMCKRPCFHNEYLPTFNRATGFEVQQTGIYNRIEGEQGIELNEKYTDGIRTLLGIHTQGYPNLFIMGGYQASFQFNLTDLLQVQGDHIANVIDYVRSNEYDTVDVTRAAEEFWVQEVISHRGKTDRNKECTPGYYNFEGAENRRQDGNYNGGFHAYIDHIDAIGEDMGSTFTFTAG